MAEISLTGDQMLTVLETVTREGPLSAAEVARQCDINRTVAHRLLTTLATRSYLRRSEKGYVLGPAILRLVASVDFDMRAVARPIMLRLSQETGETVVLHAIDHAEAIVIEQVVGQKHIVRVEHTPGSRHALHKGASGLSLLAFQEGGILRQVLKKVENPAAVRARMERTRNDGYAISHDELLVGVHGVAVPILHEDGRCQLSLAILVPSLRADLLLSFLDALRAASRKISGMLS